MENYLDSEKRSKILGSGKRSAWLRVDELIRRKADVQSGMTCVDLGCGAGVIALPLSLEIGPEGRVYAVDTNQELLDRIKAKVPPEWLVTLNRDAADTGLDAGVADVCFMVLFLHEVEPVGVIREAFRLLKPGGKIVLLEWKKEWDSPHPPVNERISREEMELLLTGEGFGFVDYEDWTENQYVVTAKKQNTRN